MNPVSEKIDELMTKELTAHPERLVSFFERIQANYDEAIRTATQFFIFVLIAWFSAYAIELDLIKKIPFLEIELDHKMLVIAPFLVGVLSYGLFTSMAASVLLWEAHSRGMHHLLPTAWQNSLDDLIAPPTFSNVERMLEAKVPSLFARTWYLLVSLMMFGGSLVTFLHTVYLSWTGFHPVLWGMSSIVGVFAWTRGVVLMTTAITATGGSLGLRHHRGNATGKCGVVDEK